MYLFCGYRRKEEAKEGGKEKMRIWLRVLETYSARVVTALDLPPEFVKRLA